MLYDDFGLYTLQTNDLLQNNDPPLPWARVNLNYRDGRQVEQIKGK